MHKAILLLGTALSGCSMAPKYQQPAMPTPPVYPAASSSNDGQAVAATELGWRDFFLDPRLHRLIETALEKNRDLAQSYARIDQARAQFRVQESQRLPMVEANGNGVKSRQPLNALGLGNALPGGTGGAPDAIEMEQYSANVGVSAFELDLWGRVRNMAESERQNYLASIEGARAFRLSLIAQVASTWYAIEAGEERIRLAEQSLAGRREGVRIARKRLDAGVTSTIDHDQAVLLLTQAETEIADIRRTTEVSRNLLDVLLGGPLDQPPGDLTLRGQQVRAIAPGLPSDLLRNRPDILQAEHALRGANADIGAARAAFFPSISLTGSFGFISNALGDLFDKGNRSWNYGGAVNLPIFDWGRRSAQLKLSKARADELTAAYQRAVQGAFQEVSDALVSRQRYGEQIVAQTRAVDAQRRLARTARLRYDNGIAIYLEVLDAERNLFAGGQQLIQLRMAELQNAVSLYVALGGDAAASDETTSLQGISGDAS